MPNELDVLPKVLRREVERALAAGVVAGGCLWYDRVKRVCLHYDNRPEVCRQFELGGDECVELWSATVSVSVRRSETRGSADC